MLFIDWPSSKFLFSAIETSLSLQLFVLDTKKLFFITFHCCSKDNPIFKIYFVLYNKFIYILCKLKFYNRYKTKPPEGSKLLKPGYLSGYIIMMFCFKF